MPMVPRLVPSPVLETARPHRVLAAWPQHRRVVAVPAAALALAPATLPALVPAPALGAEAEVAPVEVISPVLVLATLPAQVVETSPAAVVGTRSQFDGE
jgi:hypothetical protein